MKRRSESCSSANFGRISDQTFRETNQTSWTFSQFMLNGTATNLAAGTASLFRTKTFHGT